MKKIFWILIVSLIVLSSEAFATKGDTNKAVTKFSRGVTNVATCWGEYINQLPKSVDQAPDYLSASIVNIFRGTAFTVARAGTGVYDIVTAPFPGKTNYKPLMKPDTVFEKTMDTLTE